MDRSKWKRVRFGDVVRCVDKTCRDPQAEGLTRVVGLEHLDPGELEITRWADVADGTSFTRTFRAGQVLFGKRRAYQRKAARVSFDGVCSGDLLVLEAADGYLLPELLPHLVQTDAFFDHALETSAGSLSPRTKWSSLGDFVFSLPPKSDQERLLTVLEANALALSSIKACPINDLRRMTLKKLMNEAQNWMTARIGDFGEVRLGRQRSPKYETGIFPTKYLRAGNVLDGCFELTDVLEMDFNEKDFSRYRLQPGDILLTEGDLISERNVGRSALWRGELENCCFQNTLIRFRANDALTPEFAHRLFQHCYYEGLFARVASKTTVTHLGAERFSDIVVSIPTLEEQNRIATALQQFDDAETARSEQVGRLRDLLRQFRSLFFEEGQSSV